MTKLFLNLDIETTGLNPREDYILEIAWEVLDEKLNTLTEPCTFIVNHETSWGHVFSRLRNAPRVVREMHQNSGLSAELFTDVAYTTDEIAVMIHDSLREAAMLVHPKNIDQVHLMGFSPAFDRSFLQADDAFRYFTGESGSRSLNHRLFDLSSVKLAYEVAGLDLPVSPNPNAHRAINDIAEVRDFARFVRDEMKEFAL